MKKWPGPLLALLAISAPAMPADLPDLLVPLTDAEAAEVRANNAAWLEGNLKVSKRHRLVRVNANALLASKKVRIELFDGEALVVNRSELDVGPGCKPQYFRWSGMLSDPPLSFESFRLFIPDVTHRPTAMMIYRSWFGIAMAGEHYLYDPEEGGSWRAPASEECLDCASMQQEIAALESFYAVRAEFAHPMMPSVYRLLPLEQDPRYHLLLSIDTSATMEPASVSVR